MANVMDLRKNLWFMASDRQPSLQSHVYLSESLPGHSHLQGQAHRFKCSENFDTPVRHYWWVLILDAANVKYILQDVYGIDPQYVWHLKFYRIDYV